MSDDKIDYKLLLTKYMSWVGHQEGVYFIPLKGEMDTFSDGEIEALNALVPVADNIKFFL